MLHWLVRLSSLAVAASFLPPTVRSDISSRRVSGFAMQQQQPKPEALREAEKLAESAATFFGGLAKVAEDAADSWVNSGWQVKKRAGQALPEIRPNAVDISKRTTEYLVPVSREAVDDEAGEAGAAEKNGSPGPTGALAANGASAALVTPQADALQGDFLVFLAEREEEMETSGACRVSSTGELTFRSRDALAQVVVQFSMKKLSELAAAARALARYVDDLEMELEVADESVVKLRKEMVAIEQQASREQTKMRSLEEELARLRGELDDAQQRIDVQKAAKEEAEAKADAAAREMLGAQAANVTAAVGGANAEAEARRMIELEERLMAAEANALEAEQSKAALERRLAEQASEQARRSIPSPSPSPQL